MEQTSNPFVQMKAALTQRLALRAVENRLDSSVQITWDLQGRAQDLREKIVDFQIHRYPEFGSIARLALKKGDALPAHARLWDKWNGYLEQLNDGMSIEVTDEELCKDIRTLESRLDFFPARRLKAREESILEVERMLEDILRAVLREILDRRSLIPKAELAPRP